MEKLTYNNIFDAIVDDSAEAVDLEFRADLMLVIREITRAKEMTQAKVADALDIPQPRVSELLNGKVDLFSSDKLIRFLSRLGFRMKPQFDASLQKAFRVKAISA